MYWNTDDGKRFTDGERAALQASALYARLAWSRAEADSTREALIGDERAEMHEKAMRERFRAAHRQAALLESETEAGDEDDDHDEYGYAA